jgi:hypothetical protein
MRRIFIKIYFLFTAGSVIRIKRFTAGCKHFTDEEVETEVRKWLRQQPKDFCAAVFDSLVKHGTGVSVLVVDMSRYKWFFTGSNITCFKFYIRL